MWKHSINARSSQSIIIGIDLSIDESIKIGKSDLIDIDCIYQSVEIVDCKTVVLFLKISKDIGKAWRKSLTRAKRASLTRCFQPHSRPFVWLLARTWIRKNTDCFAVYRKRWHTRFILIFTDFIDFVSEDIYVHQEMKTEFMQPVNKLFYKTRFKIFFWWLILARFVSAQFFMI